MHFFSFNLNVNDNSYQMKLRNADKCFVTHCNTERLKCSAIPQMQNDTQSNHSQGEVNSVVLVTGEFLGPGQLEKFQ